MKKIMFFGAALALVGVGAAYAGGQFPDYPLATSSPASGYATTLPLTGSERIPADTMLPSGIMPQTEAISTSQLKAYVLTSPVATGPVTLQTYTIATVPTCTAALQGAIASISNGRAYATDAAGAALSTTGAVTRLIVCTNTGGATTYAWAYN